MVPVAIIEIAGDNHETDGFVDCSGDKIVQGLTGRQPHAIGGHAFVAGQPTERAIEVNVGRVQKLESRQRSPHVTLPPEFHTH